MKTFTPNRFLKKLTLPFLILIACSFGNLTAIGQMLFYDGFNDGITAENWSTTYGWTSENGKAINDVGGTSSFLTSVPSFSETDYYVETLAGPFKPGYFREYFLLFGLEDDSDNAGYGIRIDATFDKIRLVKSTDNFYFPEVLTVVDTALSETADYNIRVEHTSNGDIEVYFAEAGSAFPSAPIISGNDLTYGSLGRIGWLPSSETAPELFYVDYMQAGTLGDELFCDNFSGSEISQFWRNDGTWSVQNNEALNSNFGEALITEASFNAPSYIIQTTVSNLVTGYYRGYNLFFGVQDGNENFGYAFEIDAYGNENILTLGRNDGNYYFPTTLDTEPFPTDPNRDYTFRIEKYDNGLIQVYLDEGAGFGEEPLLEAIDNTYSNLGQFGWGVYTETADEDFFVDDICATVPGIQKTSLEKSPQTTNVLAYYTRDIGEYDLGAMAVGATHYVDRNYTITSLPSYLDGATFLKTANNDKMNTSDETVLYAYFEQPTIAYVAYDPRGSVLPEWLDGNGWVKTNDVIGSTDIGTSYFEIYRKNLFNAYFYTGHYSVAIGANLAPPALGSNANYFVAFINAPITARYEAEGATLSGAVVASNHSGFSANGFADYVNPSNDYVEWNITIDAPNTYNFSFRYALGASQGRPLALSIDGATVSTLAFNSSAQWSNWYTKSNIRGVLEAGEHTLRLTATGNSGPNLDYLEVTPTNITPNILIPAAIAKNENQAGEGSYAFFQEVDWDDADWGTIQMYPNPGKDNFTIALANANGTTMIHAFDVQGREVYNFRLAGMEGGAALHQVDTQAWPSGLYVISVVSGSETTTAKWMKQ